MATTTELVTEVIDGDTFRTAAGRVRLEGVNAPELHERGGQEAKKRLKSLIEGKIVSIETVARDQYGRRVAQVTIGGRSVNRAVDRKK